MHKGEKVEKFFGFLSFFISEKRVKKVLMKIRNKKYRTSNMALKIHGRKPEDYIFVSNLVKLKTIDFAEEEFYIQPDCKRMLDKIYGEFDSNKREENRHRITNLKI